MNALKQYFELITMIILFTIITILWIGIAVIDTITRKETQLD